MKGQLNRIKELVSILNNASKMYYQFNTSIMTDHEYDHLYDELVSLEKDSVTILL